jgi:succinate-semialdehyde dehydrogenase/glutarate-semialdehyde dehydrogenase
VAASAGAVGKPVLLELGGKSANIVFDDADLDAAVDGAMTAKYRNNGQTCVCANRIYVQKGIYDEFAKRFADKVRGFKLGAGFGDGVTHGPVIHERAVDKVDQHVRDAASKGANVVLGGQKVPSLGPTFYDPTVLTGVNKDMLIASEETFGPVAALFPFESEKEVVDLANRAEVGLAGYFFSRDVHRIFRVAEELEVGMVGANTGIISDVASP